MILELDSSYSGNLEPYDPIHRTQSMLRFVGDIRECYGSSQKIHGQAFLDVQRMSVGCHLETRYVEVSSSYHEMQGTKFLCLDANSLEIL